MSSTCSLISDKARCFSQSEHALYENFIINNNKRILQIFIPFGIWRMCQERQPRPMCLNTWRTLVADPPVRRMHKQRRKIPAGMWEPGISGWLCQVLCFMHSGLLQEVFITASVPISLVSTVGLSALHMWQNLNRSNNWDKKTMCLGSERIFLSFSDNL